MTQALHSAIESINALSLEEKHQLWLILDEAIAQAEESDWLEDENTKAEIQQVREEYQKGEYIIFSEYIAQK
jgi:phage-related protein